MKKTGKWPANDKPANFEDLTRSVRKALRFAYKMQRKNEGKSIPVAGYDLPKSAIAPAASVLLNTENLKYSKENQGRDALDEIIGYAIRLGIEQGRRIVVNDRGLVNVRLTLNELRRTLEDFGKL